MADVKEIINTLGGSTVVASAIGAPLTTVHSWTRVGYVPSWRIPTLVKLAKKTGKPVREEDFPVRPAAVKQVAA